MQPPVDESEQKSRRHRSIPAWVVIIIGAVITGAGLLWSSTLYDQKGEAVLDPSTASVLVALLGLVGTILAVLLQRTAEVRHQVKNSHPSNLRDDVDAVRAEIAEVRGIAEHGVRAARAANHEATQTREDVQQLRADLTGTASDIRGIRRDIGRLADQKEKP